MDNKKHVMLGKVVEKVIGLPLVSLRVLYDLLEKLAMVGDGWQEWLEELKKFLRKEKCWTDVIVETVLDFIGTVDVPARTGKFVAKDHFVIDTSKKAKVKISDLGDNFKKNFLSKTEGIFSGGTLRYNKLKKWLRSITIINALGGDDAAETLLAEMFGLMELQPNGEAGALLTNGYANIFFIRDANDVLWTVRCRWRAGGWSVYANPVDDSLEWDVGHPVFSRNSLEAQS